MESLHSLDKARQAIEITTRLFQIYEEMTPYERYKFGGWPLRTKTLIKAQEAIEETIPINSTIVVDGVDETRASGNSMVNEDWQAIWGRSEPHLHSRHR